jgi:hypothetical protein
MLNSTITLVKEFSGHVLHFMQMDLLFLFERHRTDLNPLESTLKIYNYHTYRADLV